MLWRAVDLSRQRTCPVAPAHARGGAHPRLGAPTSAPADERAVGPRAATASHRPARFNYRQANQMATGTNASGTHTHAIQLRWGAFGESQVKNEATAATAASSPIGVSQNRWVPIP